MATNTTVQASDGFFSKTTKNLTEGVTSLFNGNDLTHGQAVTVMPVVAAASYLYGINRGYKKGQENAEVKTIGGIVVW